MSAHIVDDAVREVARLQAEVQTLLDACIVAERVFSQPSGCNVPLEHATLNLLRMTIHAVTQGQGQGH